jgi:hypothetical protein
MLLWVNFALECTEYVLAHGNRCGFGAVLSMTTGQKRAGLQNTSTMDDNVCRADARIREERRIKLTGIHARHFARWCTQHCPRPSGLQKSGFTLGVKNLADDQKLVYGTGCHVYNTLHQSRREVCTVNWYMG